MSLRRAEKVPAFTVSVVRPDSPGLFELTLERFRVMHMLQINRLDKMIVLFMIGQLKDAAIMPERFLPRFINRKCQSWMFRL